MSEATRHSVHISRRQHAAVKRIARARRQDIKVIVEQAIDEFVARAIAEKNKQQRNN